MEISIRIEEVWSDNKWLPKSISKTNCKDNFTYRYRPYLYVNDGVCKNYDSNYVHKSLYPLQHRFFGFLIIKTYVYSRAMTFVKTRTEFEKIFGKGNGDKKYIVFLGFKITV